jgi:hypothetical protein
MAGDLALARIVDIGGVVVKRRQRADDAAHDRHRMRVAAETAIERRELVVHHRVHGDGAVEIRHLLLVRQVAVQQQVADFQKARMLRELVDGIAAIEQDALVAVDEGDVAFAACRGGETGVVSEDVDFPVKLADVYDVRPLGAGIDRKVVFFVFVGERRATGRLQLALSHGMVLLMRRDRYLALQQV